MPISAVVSSGKVFDFMMSSKDIYPGQSLINQFLINCVKNKAK